MASRHSSNFSERYRVIRLLGQGGMGQVYEAEQCNLGRRVAIKRLLADTRDPAARLRLEKEARALAQVRSPHVVQVFDTDQDESGFVVVMELLHGVTLGDYVERERPPLAEIVAIVRDAALGLAAAHAAGIVHRDVKPENIFLANEGGARVVKMVDFGIAKDTAPEAGHTSPSEIVGTPRYMAPEYMQGRRPTLAVDLFALGVVLYHFASGAWPYDGDNSARYMYAVIGRRQVPITARVPSIAAPLAQAITRCLAPEPSDRYASAGELVDALNIALEALRGIATHGAHVVLPRISAPPETTVGVERSASGAIRVPQPSLNRTPPRQGGSAALVAVVASVIALAAGAAVWLAMRAPSAAPSPSVDAGAANAESAVAAIATPKADPVFRVEAGVASAATTTPHLAPTPAPSSAPSPSPGASPSSPHPSAAVPDPAGNCGCLAGTSNLCPSKTATSSCMCAGSSGVLCIDARQIGPTYACAATTSRGGIHGAACTGVTMAGVKPTHTSGAGTLVCSWCAQTSGNYRGTTGATCTGFDEHTGAPGTGQLACR